VQILRASSHSSHIHSHTVISMGKDQVSDKRVTMHHELEELRLIRAALRFAQASKERPLTFDQDLKASELVRRISRHLISS